MLLKALDLLRTLGWSLVHFIFSLIDSLFDILKGLNAFDIINSVSGDNNFSKFQTGVIAIAVTLLLVKILEVNPASFIEKVDA